MTRHDELRTATAVLFAAGLLFASGCWIEVDDGVHPRLGVDVQVEADLLPPLADLEVRWSIDRRDGAALCSIYGVDRWRIALDGPEVREVLLDCRADWWSTESDFYALLPGSYRLTITALEWNGMIRGALATPVLLDRAGLQRIAVDFDGATF